MTYRGVDEKGAGVSGVLATDDVGAWVQKKYRRGWKFLTVIEGNREVGGIERPPLGKPIWWAEA